MDASKMSELKLCPPEILPESLVAGLETLADFRVSFPFWNKVVSDGRAKRPRPPVFLSVGAVFHRRGQANI